MCSYVVWYGLERCADVILYALGVMSCCAMQFRARNTLCHLQYSLPSILPLFVQTDCFIGIPKATKKDFFTQAGKFLI